MLRSARHSTSHPTMKYGTRNAPSCHQPVSGDSHAAKNSTSATAMRIRFFFCLVVITCASLPIYSFTRQSGSTLRMVLTAAFTTLSNWSSAAVSVIV